MCGRGLKNCGARLWMKNRLDGGGNHGRRESRGNNRHVYYGRKPRHVRPDAEHAREGLAALEMLVVQDIFLTETAAFADVILPASVFAEKTGTFTNTDRMVQLGRRALETSRRSAARFVDYYSNGKKNGA